MNKVNAIIVDDESKNRDLISQMVCRTNPDFNILGTAENIDVAYDLITKYSPDLIFLDIKMPGGNGFELIKRFSEPKFEVVFVTAFEDYAVKAFEFNALDYILKPIDSSKLKITLERVQTRIRDKHSVYDNLQNFLSYYDDKNYIISKIPIHYMDKVELISVSEIVSIEADNGYTVFKTMHFKTFISSKQFSTFEFILEKFSFFVKISRGIFINLNYVKNYSKGEYCVIKMINNDDFDISRRKKAEILSILDKIN